MHQILRDNALGIGLYNNLYYITSPDHVKIALNVNNGGAQVVVIVAP